MKVIANWHGRPRLRKLISAASLAVILMMSVAISAQADNRGGHGGGRGYPDARRGERDWRNHERYVHRYWGYPGYRPEPGVIYAPPVVYAPPLLYQSPGINFIIPLHIR